MATSRRKSRGSSHHCATKARSPHKLGKGQGQGPGTKCHYLHAVLLGSSITPGSRYFPTLSCLGSSAQRCSPARAAGVRLPQPPGLRLLPQLIPPGENAATRAAAPVSLGLVLGASVSRAITPLAGRPGSLQSPCLGCLLHGCWLLLAHPGSSPEQILC